MSIIWIISGDYKHTFCQLQGLKLVVITGMNIRMPQATQASGMDSSSVQVPKNVNEDISDPGLGNQLPVFAPHGMGQGVIHPSNQGSSQDERRSVSNLERASCCPCCHVIWYHGWCRGMSYSTNYVLINCNRMNFFVDFFRKI